MGLLIFSLHTRCYYCQMSTDETYMTLGASGLWPGTRTGADGTATLNLKIFWPQSMVENVSFPSFSLPDVLCYPTDLIWR
jgi:hypothetical protein